jgi:galactose mutarotase-like enzyme
VVIEPDVELADAHLRAVLSPARGFLIASLRDAASGAPLLWERRAPVGALTGRELGPPGPGSLETFHRGFLGGWFAMFPAAGFTGELDGLPTYFHGELARLPWQLTEGSREMVEARVETVQASFSVVRRVTLAGGELRVKTWIANSGSRDAGFVFGEHPCFSRATFAGGRLSLKAAAAWVPSPAYDPAGAALVPGSSFSWPLAPSRGSHLDLSQLPSHRDCRSDHVCLELGDRLLRLSAPQLGRVAELELDLETTPFALLGARFDAEVDMLAIEPSTAPGRGVPDALAAGAVRSLAPGESFETETVLRWR